MSVCPTPAKWAFPSRRAAITQAKRYTKKPLKDGQMRAYRCSCGAWHLTSMTKHEAREVAKRRAA